MGNSPPAPAAAVKIGAWGGTGGNAYDFRGEIRGIRITYGDYIDSIEFRLNNNSTVRIGGGNGEGINQRELGFVSGQYLKNISGTISVGSGGYVQSLVFHTNQGDYAFGTPENSTLFTIPLDDAIVTGMFGRHGWHVDSIGFYASPH